jgi:hypothetical protein
VLFSRFTYQKIAICFSLAIYDGAPVTSTNGAVSGLAANRKDEDEGNHVDLVEPDQSVLSIV